MKINNEIITTFDIEQEINYFLALNPQLNRIDDQELEMLAKKSIIKEKLGKMRYLSTKN